MRAYARRVIGVAAMGDGLLGLPPLWERQANTSPRARAPTHARKATAERSAMGRRRLRLPLAGALALLCTAGVAAQVEEGAPAFGNATAQWLASGSRALLQAPGDAACAGGIRNGAPPGTRTVYSRGGRRTSNLLLRRR